MKDPEKSGETRLDLAREHAEKLALIPTVRLVQCA